MSQLEPKVEFMSVEAVVGGWRGSGGDLQDGSPTLNWEGPGGGEEPLKLAMHLSLVETRLLKERMRNCLHKSLCDP